jgi:hypothetical protein
VRGHWSEEGPRAFPPWSGRNVPSSSPTTALCAWLEQSRHYYYCCPAEADNRTFVFEQPCARAGQGGPEPQQLEGDSGGGAAPVHVSPSPALPPSLTSFLSSARGRSVLFLGDSMMGQTVQALNYSLAIAGVAVTSRRLPYNSLTLRPLPECRFDRQIYCIGNESSPSPPSPGGLSGAGADSAAPPLPLPPPPPPCPCVILDALHVPSHGLRLSLLRTHHVVPETERETADLAAAVVPRPDPLRPHTRVHLVPLRLLRALLAAPRSPLRRPDLVLYNIGLHYAQYHPAGFETALRALTRALAQQPPPLSPEGGEGGREDEGDTVPASASPSPRLVYRLTLPQHFDALGGMYEVRRAGGEGQQEQCPGGGPGARHWTDTYAQGLILGGGAGGGGGVSSSVVVDGGNENGVLSRVHVLDYGPVFGPRHDLHVIPGAPGDCTHLCFSREMWAPLWAALGEMLDEPPEGAGAGGDEERWADSRSTVEFYT